MGTALDEVSDTFVPCGCPCHDEHEHEWEGRAGQGDATCRLCGARRVAHQCRVVEATTYDDMALGRRTYVCTEPGHEGPTTWAEVGAS